MTVPQTGIRVLRYAVVFASLRKILGAVRRSNIVVSNTSQFGGNQSNINKQEQDSRVFAGDLNYEPDLLFGYYYPFWF